MHRTLLTIVIAALTLCAAAVPLAHAHTSVASTSPSKGGTATTSLRAVSVTFNQTVQSGTLTVKKGRTVFSIGAGARDPRNTKRVSVRIKAPSTGSYTATWRITAADGHVQTGTFTFRVA